MSLIKEVVFNLEQRNYSYNELKGILNHSDRNISHIFKSRGIVSQIKEKCRITGNLCMHFSYEQINNAFKSHRLYPVPKKERKPYFEFAYQEYQSKINK